MLMSKDAELLFASLPIFCSSFSLSFRSRCTTGSVSVHLVRMRIGYASLLGRIRFAFGSHTVPTHRAEVVVDSRTIEHRVEES